MNANDRCDRCTAAAMVRFNLLNGELLFCGHHSKEFGPALKDKSISIEDPEHLLHPALATV